MAVSSATAILDRFAVAHAGTLARRLADGPRYPLCRDGRFAAQRAGRRTRRGWSPWAWLPGKTLERAEERALNDWKGGLYPPVIRCVSGRSPMVRAAAVACLGNLPEERSAAPAVAYLEDMSEGAGIVRKQVLVSFARRRDLMTEDAVLKRLYDPEPGIPELAEIVLKTRGLTTEQISLGRMIFHPKPELRASVIPLLRDRTDIDPVVWLLQLSRDEEPSVRAGAVDALAGRPSPEVRRRLAEMAKFDQSPLVRRTAPKSFHRTPRRRLDFPRFPARRASIPRRTNDRSDRTSRRRVRRCVSGHALVGLRATAPGCAGPQTFRGFPSTSSQERKNGVRQLPCFVRGTLPLALAQCPRGSASGSAAPASAPVLILGEVAGAEEEEDEAQDEHGNDREHADAEVSMADRAGADQREHLSEPRRGHGGLAEPLRDRADQHRRLDVPEEVDQEDAHCVTGRALVRGHDVGGHRVARPEDHRQGASPRTAPERSAGSGSTVRTSPGRIASSDRESGHEQIGTAGHSQQGSASHVPDDPKQAGDRDQAPIRPGPLGAVMPRTVW